MDPEYIVGIITKTSVGYALSHIKTANLETLKKALEHETENRKRKTMIRMLKREIAKRES